ncbi:MAG: phosphoribulokinase [Nevskiaceae bacterium]|nr:MAG: phosphoribulokinase [Nevskiaceae bacterium]
MSAKHPIIGVTGSSGAGTSTVLRMAARLFAELGVRPAIVEGDAFHAYDRAQLRAAMERARIRGENFSLFGPGGNLLERLDSFLRDYGDAGTGVVRRYLHTEAEAAEAGQNVGTFTPWERLPPDTDMLFYEGLHGGYVGDEINIARHMDLLFGVVPVINLEWIQKIRRDTEERGHNPEDVARTILRRMPDYVNHIVPQFSKTDVNFQRVPLVDTSNPFVVRDIPAPHESLVVVHFNDHSRVRVDFETLIGRLPGAFQSHAQTLVVPGTMMDEAMALILRPAIESLMRGRQAALNKERA